MQGFFVVPASRHGCNLSCSHVCRSWDEAYEQLTYERGACNLVQKYSPQLVRDRVFSGPNATWIIMVRSCARLPSCLPGTTVSSVLIRYNTDELTGYRWTAAVARR